MTSAQGIAAPRALSYAAMSVHVVRDGAAPSVVREPEIDAAAMNDGLAQLLLMMSKQHGTSLEAGKARVHSNEAARKAALTAEKESLDKAREDNGGRGLWKDCCAIVSHLTENVATFHFADAVDECKTDLSNAADDPKFWSDFEALAKDVAKIAGAVASIALTCVTFGAGGVAAVLVIAAIAASAGSEVVARTGCFGDDSGKVALGLSLASAACTLGAGAAASGASVATEASTVASTSASSASTGGSVLGVSTATWSTVGNGAGAVQGASAVVEGGAHIEVARFQSDAIDAGASAVGHRHEAEREERDTAWLLACLTAASKSHDRATELVHSSIETNDQSMLTATLSARG